MTEGKGSTVSRNGRPVGELRPLQRDRLVDASLVAAAFGDAPPIDREAFRRDVDEHLDQGIDPRA